MARWPTGSRPIWTLPRIATVLERLTGVRHHPAHVWRLLQKLNWSLQRPARQARERDDRAIRQWMRECWPQVKRTPAAGMPGSSSRTKAGSRSFRSSAAPGRPGADPHPEAHTQRLAARVGRRRPGLSLGRPTGAAVLPAPRDPPIAARRSSTSSARCVATSVARGRSSSGMVCRRTAAASCSGISRPTVPGSRSNGCPPMPPTSIEAPDLIVQHRQQR
jgi:hypothetical protein